MPSCQFQFRGGSWGEALKSSQTVFYGQFSICDLWFFNESITKLTSRWVWLLRADWTQYTPQKNTAPCSFVFNCFTSMCLLQQARAMIPQLPWCTLLAFNYLCLYMPSKFLLHVIHVMHKLYTKYRQRSQNWQILTVVSYFLVPLLRNNSLCKTFQWKWLWFTSKRNCKGYTLSYEWFRTSSRKIENSL